MFWDLNIVDWTAKSQGFFVGLEISWIPGSTWNDGIYSPSKQHRPCPKLAVITCNFPRMDVLREKNINPSISILLLLIHELWSWCSQPTPPRQEWCLMLLDTRKTDQKISRHNPMIITISLCKPVRIWTGSNLKRTFPGRSSMIFPQWFPSGAAGPLLHGDEFPSENQ